ncbi:MAG TPA: four helix bundle protein [Saprospiraceae bacterium]|nr:four helix bundle protein [Saprospiraceae bacterium]
MTNQEFNEWFRRRTRAFGVKILRFVESLPPTSSGRVIGYQLGKAGTSVGANFRAFTRGRSNNERYSKICITVEEADESAYWLELSHDLKYGNPDLLKELASENDEIIKVISSIKNSLYTIGQ